MGKHSARPEAAELEPTVVVPTHRRSPEPHTAVLSATEVHSSVVDGLAQARTRHRVETKRLSSSEQKRSVVNESKHLVPQPGVRKASDHKKASRHKVVQRKNSRGARTFTVSTVTTAMATSIVSIGFFGGFAAQASQPLTTSIVGGTSQSVSAPAVLAGGENAALRSQVSEAKQLSISSPETRSCAVTGAQGIRAAFVADDSHTVVMPIEQGAYTITSPFGYRIHPITGQLSFHAGVDFAAPLNTPIHAIADGVVTYVGEGIEGRSNDMIIVEHEIDGHVYESWYIHMYEDGLLVSVGDHVSAGDVIARVGSNGNSTGPHLHLEIHDPSLASDDEKSELLSPLTFLADHNAVDVSALCQ